MSPQLVGVGMGPGDPDLVTVKAVRVLRAADLILVPTMDLDAVGRAERTVRTYVDHDRLQRLYFALNERRDRERRERAWDAAGEAVAAAFANGAELVAFATIGDPNVYSTFSYLAATARQLVPGLEVSTVPGITAMQHLAAESGVPLVEGEETLTLYPMTAGLDGYREALRRGDTVVAYKGGRHLPAVLDALTEQGRTEFAVVGVELGLPGSRVVAAGAIDTAVDPELVYLSTVLSPPGDRSRGGHL